MIMGYQLYRILVNLNTKSKKRKELIERTLLDPGNIWLKICGSPGLKCHSWASTLFSHLRSVGGSTKWNDVKNFVVYFVVIYCSILYSADCRC